MIRIAMLSRWHVHANDYARQVKVHPDTVITAVWDEIPERGAAWAKELEAAFEADLDVLLARSDVDAVIVDAPTNIHGAVMVKAALAGKHIFTEKVMALREQFALDDVPVSGTALQKIVAESSPVYRNLTQALGLTAN
jgi:predicted dehydrogenase